MYNERHRVAGVSDVDEELDHQGMAIELIDAFTVHDTTGLTGLDRPVEAGPARH